MGRTAQCSQMSRAVGVGLGSLCVIAEAVVLATALVIVVWDAAVDRSADGLQAAESRTITSAARNRIVRLPLFRSPC